MTQAVSSNPCPVPTCFAPAERAEPDVIVRQVALFRDNPLVGLLDSVTDLVMILNSHRQIVYANDNLLALLEMPDVRDIMGMRPGELFSCEHASASAGGCGTTEHCKHCGAVKVILCALQNDKAVDECHITQRQGDAIVAYDLKVCGTPFEFDGDRFVVFAINDVSHEKRRRALERIFFHDLLNTAGGLRNLASMILDEVPLDLKDETLLLHKFSSELVDEIMAQRVLLAAESDELTSEPSPVNPCDVLEQVREMYASHEVAQGKTVVIDPSDCGCMLDTDVTLLKRVLSNMLKNALEACVSGDVVSMGCQREGDSVDFWVHNPGVISKETQAQIFQRSFSTKGRGRGLGTYSIRLLTVNYLKGQVGFRSTESEGTRFVVTLPLTVS